MMADILFLAVASWASVWARLPSRHFGVIRRGRFFDVFHIEQAKKRLGVKTRIEAVAAGVLKGVI